MTHGDGSIFKTKDGRGRMKWKVEVTIGHNPDGSRKRTRRTATSHADAKKIRRKLLTDRDDYRLNFDNPTLDTFALWWIRDVKALQVKLATAADYEHRYRKIISPTFGHMTLADISSQDVSTWIGDLRLNYADTSINGALRVMKMILSAAVDHQYLRLNVASRIPGIKSHESSTPPNRPWNIHETRSAVESAKTHPFGIPVLLALQLGLRKGEILGLKWGDIDFEEGLMHIRRSRREFLAYNPDGSTRFDEAETEPKTRASKRTLIIGDTLQQVLLAEAHRVFGGPFTTDEAHLFSNSRTGAPVTTKDFANQFEDFVQASDLRKVRFHDLRHSAAQAALAAGIRIESVSQSLGHSRIDTTKAIYAPSVQPLSAEFGSTLENFLSSD